MSDQPPIEEVVNAWAKQLLERDVEQMTARLQEPITFELLAAKAPLRPNVTPVNQPAIRLLPLLFAVLLSVPWWIGAWQIVRWIWR